jgi:hypothetical protein
MTHFVPKWQHELDQASRPSRPTAGPRALGPAVHAPFASPFFISRNCNNADTLASRTLATTHFSALPGFVPALILLCLARHRWRFRIFLTFTQCAEFARRQLRLG